MGTPTLSIRDYAALMVTLSDNTATNVLIDRLGMERIAARMQALGLTGTKLRRHMMDTAAARRGDENVSTPRRARAAAAGDARAGCRTRDRAAEEAEGEPAAEGPAATASQSADKSGELDGVRVDAGIVFAKNRPYVLSRDDDVPEETKRKASARSKRSRAPPTSTSAAWAPAARSAA